MREIIRQAELCKGDWNAFFACDINFHMAVVKAGKNQMSLIIHTVVSQLISDMIAHGFLGLTAKERERHRKDVLITHKALLDAIVVQDAERAKDIIISHLNEFKHFMIEENVTINS